MKDLLENLFMSSLDYYTSKGIDGISFNEWYEQNQSKIDDAVLNHIKDNYPTLYSAFVIAKLAKQYDIQVVDSKDATPITPEIFGLNSTLYNDLKSIREEKDQMVERGVLK